MAIAIQVNGKLRATIELAVNSEGAAAEAAARAAVAKYLATGEVRKTIYVPNKIVNFVVREGKPE